MKNRKMSLLCRFLLAYVLCVFLPSGLVGSYLYAKDIQQIHETSMERAYADVVGAADQMDLLLREERQISSQIMANRELNRAIRQQGERIKWGEQFEDYLLWREAISILSPTGVESTIQLYFENPTIYSGVIPAYQNIAVLEEKGIMQELVFQGQRAFRCTQWHRLSLPDTDVVISIYRLLTRADGSKDRFVMEYVVDAEWVLENKPGAVLADWEMIALLDGSGNVLAALGDRKHDLEGKGLEVDSYDYDNKYFRARVSLPMADWQLMVVRSVDYIVSYPGVISTGVRYLIPAVVFSVLLTGLFFLWIDRRLRRMVQWTDGMQDYTTTRDIAIEYCDEIGDLEGHMNDMLHNIRHMIREITEKEERRRDAEIRMLLSQINPHFLYNTLESIHWKAVDHGEEELGQSIIELSRFLRRSFTHEGFLTSIATELSQVCLYMRIQQKSMRREVRLNIQVPEELMNAEMLHLSLQPLVENSLIHGIKEDMKECSEICITVQRIGNELVISVIDNGVGMSPEHLQKIRIRLAEEQYRDECFALWNVNFRLRAQYGERAGLMINSIEGLGTTISFRIPYCIYEPVETETIG